MRRFQGLLIGLVLLLLGFSARAQWSGSADLSGGLGVMEGSIVTDDKPMFHALAEGAFRLDYTTDKFKWSTSLSGSWEPNTTDNARLALKEEKLGIVYKAATTKPLSFKLRSDFLWTPAPDRKYSSWILYRRTADRAFNHSINLDGNVDNMDKLSYYYEVPVLNERELETGVRTYRSFDAGRAVLQGSLVFQAVGSKKNNTWTVFKTGEGQDDGGGMTVDLGEDVQGYAWRYRITPDSRDFNVDGDIHLQRTVLDGTTKLKFAPGIRLSTRHALDENSGATCVNLDLDNQDGTEASWRDSTRLRESFDYLSLRMEPYLTADFKWKDVEAHADYACQVYTRRLNDDTHQQPLRVKGVYPVGRANVKWTISPRHSLNLVNQMSVSHPDYLKICWYDRTAGYLDQLYRGNEQLLSPNTLRFALEYEFKRDGFVSRSTVSYTQVNDEIDQTWSNDEIDGRIYKVFRWVNSSDSRSVGLTQKLGWQGKVITANADVTYSQSRRKAKSGDTIKDSFNWVLNTDVTANLGKGWSIGSDAHYQSRVATFFTIFKQYCKLNAHVQKDFKRMTLYLEGRDLLDQQMETSFESEELQEYWIEQVRHNRRIFVVGARWNF